MAARKSMITEARMLEMRRQGASYADIAKVAGLGGNRVRDICLRGPARSGRGRGVKVRKPALQEITHE